MHDAAELNRLLIERGQELCAWLFPNGKVKGHEYFVGGLDGTAGESLHITLSGAAAGRFKDFADPDHTKGATFLWLIAKAKQTTFPEAIKIAKEFLGVKDEDFGIKRHHEKTFAKPERGGVRIAEPNTPAMDYLVVERRLDPIVVANAKVCETDEGDAVVFPFLEKSPEGKEVCVHRKYLKLERPNGKKECWATKGTKKCLYGKHLIDDNVSELTITEGECYSGDTEVLTESGWIRFDALPSGAKVLQVDENGIGRFVDPLARVVKQFTGELIHFSTPQVDLLVTPGHKVIGRYYASKKWRRFAASDIGCQITIPKTAFLDGEGIPLSDLQIMFSIAISADAKVDIRKGTGATGKLPMEMRYAHFGLKKARKKQRLEWLLSSLGLACRITHGVGPDGEYSYYSMPIPDWVCGRKLPWSWITMATSAQRRLILDELIEWDGNRVAGRKQTEYSSKFEYNAEWVQAMASTSGIASTIMDRSNALGFWKKVSILNGKNTATIAPKYSNQVPFSGLVYCVTVPSGALLVRRNRKVCVCGNCDALSMHSYGIPAVSIPNGVSDMEWIDLDWEWLQRFERINVCMDMDDPGQAAAPELCKRLGLHRCYIVSLPKKDVNDCLCEGVTRDQMLCFLANAKPIELDEIKRPREYTKEVIDFYTSDWTKRGWETPWYPALPWRVRKGEFTILSGFSGSGKTIGLNQLALHLIQQGVKVMDASLEVKPALTLYNMTRCALGKRNSTPEEVNGCCEWISESMFFLDCIGTVSVKRLMHAMEYARKRHGIDVFIIDSLFKCGLDPADFGVQRDFADKLTTFCNNTGAHVILVAHSRKTMNGNEYSTPTKADVAGSSDITNAAFNVVIWWRNKLKKHKLDEARSANPPDNETIAKWIDQPDAKVLLDKQRFGEGEEAAVHMWFNGDSYQFHTTRNTVRPYFRAG